MKKFRLKRESWKRRSVTVVDGVTFHGSKPVEVGDDFSPSAEIEEFVAPPETLPSPEPEKKSGSALSGLAEKARKSEDEKVEKPKPVAKVEVKKSEPKPAPKPAPKRARDDDGQFKADDPSTPDVNEAWEQAPKAKPKVKPAPKKAEPKKEESKPRAAKKAPKKAAPKRTAKKEVK